MTDVYERDGVTLVPGVFGRGEVNRMRAAALRALTKGGEDVPYRQGGRLQMAGEYPALMFWPALVDEYLDEVRLALAPLVREVLGGNVKQLNNQLYYRLPGDGDAFAWHQDAMFRKDYSGTGDDYLQTIIAVDAMDKDNGGIGFILGSHKCRSLPPVERRRLRTASHPPTIFESPDAEAPLPVQYFAMAPGDVLCWNLMTVHGSGPNTSDRPRMTYMSGFAKASACDGWPWYLKDGQAVGDVDTDTIPYT